MDLSEADDQLQSPSEAEYCVIGTARALSRFGIKNRSTIIWKSAIEVEAIINSNAWKVAEANSAPSKIDLPINLRDKLGVILCVLFDLRGLARTANRKVQLDSFELRHLASATNGEAQLDSCGLRHFAHATMEAQLDSCDLRHFARATLEAQLDSGGLRHLAHATLEAQLDLGGLRLLARTANSTRSDFLSWHSPQV